MKNEKMINRKYSHFWGCQFPNRLFYVKPYKFRLYFFLKKFSGVSLSLLHIFRNPLKD